LPPPLRPRFGRLRIAEVGTARIFSRRPLSAIGAMELKRGAPDPPLVITERTVRRDWVKARGWLLRELARSDES